MKPHPLTALALLALAAPAFAQTAAPLPDKIELFHFKSQPTDPEKRGIEFLLKQQDDKGAFVPQVGPAITALAVRAMVQSGKPLDDPAVQKALKYIESTRKPDGGYYVSSNPNYNSAIVLSMFATLQAAVEASLPVGAKHAPPYLDQITGLQKFLKSLQQDDTKKDSDNKTITKDNPWYGGAGYGEDRPDLSNTSFMIEALRESGVPSSDPAIQKALVFVTRSQMNGETNSMPFAKGATDGGFIYTPVGGGESKFGDIDQLEGDSLLRSYGSMTYAGFKSMLYAGLTQDDPRVKAAIKWIQNNWTMDYNPGSASMDGTFYYYHTFAKAMHAWNQDTVTDDKGVKHDWRKELQTTLANAQQKDGSWTNTKSPRWFEGNATLVTTYSVLCLQEIRK